MSRQGTKASHTGGHTRSRQPTAHHHQAPNAILTVIPPPVGRAGTTESGRSGNYSSGLCPPFFGHADERSVGVETERVPCRVEHHADRLLWLVLGLLRAHLEGIGHCL